MRRRRGTQRMTHNGRVLLVEHRCLGRPVAVEVVEQVCTVVPRSHDLPMVGALANEIADVVRREPLKFPAEWIGA